ncbi:MAG: hypothetical protein JW818_00130 [Pirellulales bacterium]|nr:hypothetical protein [Pirellulales bacterium]
MQFEHAGGVPELSPPELPLLLLVWLPLESPLPPLPEPLELSLSDPLPQELLLLESLVEVLPDEALPLLVDWLSLLELSLAERLPLELLSAEDETPPEPPSLGVPLPLGIPLPLGTPLPPEPPLGWEPLADGDVLAEPLPSGELLPGEPESQDGELPLGEPDELLPGEDELPVLDGPLLETDEPNEADEDESLELDDELGELDEEELLELDDDSEDDEPPDEGPLALDVPDAALLAAELLGPVLLPPEPLSTCEPLPEGEPL